MTEREMQVIQRFLRTGKWFGGLPEALQDAILARSLVQSFAKGQVICQEDIAPKGIYGVIRGRVHLVRQIGTGDEALVNISEPGYWFGVFSALTGEPALVTAVAQTPVRLLFLPRLEVNQLIKDEPRYFAPLAKLALDRYAAMLRVVSECHDLAPERRVRVRLAAIARMRAKDVPAVGPTLLSISQADLARMVGISRQTTNEILSRLRRDGLIEIGFRSITVVDPTRLAEPTSPKLPKRRQSRARGANQAPPSKADRANW